MEGQRNKYKQPVLIDADAFVAFVKQDDTNHSKSKELFTALKSKGHTFYASYFVFSEAVTVISQRIGHETAIQFIDTILSNTSYIQILDGWSVKDKAIEIFKNQTSKNVSFVDCTNMAFLDDGQFQSVFSFDKIYQKNGYKLAEDIV
jgi:predicted nucleic acid-binding protein